MFPFGHVGTTIGLVRLTKIEKKIGHIDWRMVALTSVAADLIDKPIGLLYPEAFGNNTRLAAHSLVIWLVITFILRHFRRWNSHYGLYSVIYLFHLIQDRMWSRRELPILLWPFLGKAQPYETPALERWSYFWSDFYTYGSEAVGFAVLIFLMLRHRLYQKENFIRLLCTGRI